MSNATKARPVMHRMHLRRTDGELIQESTHDDHYMTAAEALAARVQRRECVGKPYTVEGNTFTFVDSGGFTNACTYEDVQA